MTDQKMQLDDWLDDLCVRFIINLPHEELESVERICFQVEEAQWFYEDFIRPLDPSLPSLNLRAFSLRIFQHCPLFVSWNEHHYQAAFQEFIEYKTRVPVRGAIMLNDAMDQILLVKGWKKGAHWSFPRGKINKDENDLDCAIREVYEETGYDLERAGLVKEETAMKHFEILIREQNLRLYVFRGVPQDTHFEPKTRKEISKIEWYRLSELPTLKKSKQQGDNGESLVNHANKFYNVAPFLGPLRKWISQEKKRDALKFQNALKEGTPMAIDEPLTDASATNGRSLRPRPELPLKVPSDLPEVSIQKPLVEDPSTNLKRLLNIHPDSAAPEVIPPANVGPPKDVKANALLDLLRGKAKPSITLQQPNTPLDRTMFTPDIPQTPHHHHPRPPQLSEMPPPPAFPVSPYVSEDENGGHLERPHASHSYSASANLPQVVPEHILPYLQNQNRDNRMQGQQPNVHDTASHQHPRAPYQRTGDPQFARPELAGTEAPAIPPASNLPKLNNHTRALLDVFKSGPLTQAKTQPAENSPRNRPSSLGRASNVQREILQSMTPPANRAQTARPVINGSQIPKRATSTHQASLLDLFRRPSLAPEARTTTPMQANGPAELAAQATPSPKAAITQSGELLTLLTKAPSAKDQDVTPKKLQNTSKKGQTFATISGPLNMPHFQGIQKPSSKNKVANGVPRSTPKSKVPTAPPHGSVKILSRPQNSTTPSQSPRKPEPASDVSPLSPPRKLDDPPKPFQPQILKRPQSEHRKSPSPSPLSLPTDSAQELPGISPPHSAKSRPLASANVLPPPITQNKVNLPPPITTSTSFDRRSSQPDSHKQTLLSLFSSQTPSLAPKPPIDPSNLMAPPSHTSSVAVSPLQEQQPPTLALRTNSISPPSAVRSRIGSLSSMVSGVGHGEERVQTPTSARTTTPGDRAFLMGYLERFAKGQG